MNRPLLVATGVKKHFGSGSQRVDVLRGVDVDAYPGEFVAIVGKSGSGKSTLLYCLCGLHQADEGRIRLGEHDVTGASRAQLASIRRSTMSFIFQDLNLISALNVSDNVRLPSQLAGKKVSKKEVDTVLEQVGLPGIGKKHPHQLSGGQRQRVAIARSLLRRPPLLFADEPTGSLDVTSSSTVMELLRGVTSAGTSLVMVTHDLDIAASADRVIVLENGHNSAVLNAPSSAELFARIHGQTADKGV